tara:strand:- start:9391 stop:10029 length:639 start_codon:yes stop_codon:yes gene_type:complete
MEELFELTFSAPNIVPTGLLIFVVFYWLLVMLGALDISAFDLDIDTDINSDIDGGSEVSISWINNVLMFFNIDKVPFMVFVTFLAMPMWLISLVANDFFGNTTFIISLILLIPNFVVSLLLAKPLTLPFVKLFAGLEDKGRSVNDLFGSTGRVVISADPNKLGQAEVVVDGASLLLNIKTKKGTVTKGGQILVINYIKQSNYYIVESYQSIN